MAKNVFLTTSRSKAHHSPFLHYWGGANTAKLSSATTSTESVVISRDKIRKFIEDCTQAVKTKPSHGSQLAQVLIAADYRGHFSHGVNRLDMYVNDISSGITLKEGEPILIKENVATAYVNGSNLLGPVVGNFCMSIAIQKAKEAGIGWVAAKGSNHYGIAGWYSMQALKHGLLGLSFTNTSPLVVPTRAKQPSLGTNPVTLAAPGVDGDSFVLDMATSSVALGKIELADVKKSVMPSGWGADPQGHETHDPASVLNGGGLLPLGGAEVSGGYKGYGLAMMVEIFCGIMAGSPYGPNIRKWKKTDKVADLGQCFIAVNPASFAPGFKERMQEFIDTFRGLETAPNAPSVMVPGDPEREHMSLCDSLGGIPYHINQVNNLDKLAAKLKLNPIERLTG